MLLKTDLAANIRQTLSSSSNLILCQAFSSMDLLSYPKRCDHGVAGKHHMDPEALCKLRREAKPWLFAGAKSELQLRSDTNVVLLCPKRGLSLSSRLRCTISFEMFEIALLEAM